MAIETGDLIEKFGTQVAITGSNIVVASGAFSQLSDAVSWANSDDVLEAELELDGTLAASLTTPQVIEIFIRKTLTQNPSENQPSLSNENTYIGSFNLGTDGTSQFKSTRIDLQNGRAGQQYEFYFKNSTSQQVTMTVYLTPLTYGSKA